MLLPATYASHILEFAFLLSVLSRLTFFCLIVHWIHRLCLIFWTSQTFKSNVVNSKQYTGQPGKPVRVVFTLNEKVSRSLRRSWFNRLLSRSQLSYSNKQQTNSTVNYIAESRYSWPPSKRVRPFRVEILPPNSKIARSFILPAYSAIFC